MRLALLLLLAGCATTPPPLVPAIDPNGPELEYPDAGEVNPCRGGPGEVSILSPAERRALCLHRVDWPAIEAEIEAAARETRGAP